MSIPNFRSQDDYQDFLIIFGNQWQCKLTLLNRVKTDLFPGYNWDQLQPQTLETINDIASNLVYECERQFKETHPDYGTEDEEIFIPRRSFKENVAEALNEALGNQQVHSSRDTAEFKIIENA